MNFDLSLDDDDEWLNAECEDMEGREIYERFALL